MIFPIFYHLKFFSCIILFCNKCIPLHIFLLLHENLTFPNTSCMLVTKIDFSGQELYHMTTGTKISFT